MFTNTIYRLSFGMLSVETAVFDCICWFSSSRDRKGQSYPVEYYLEAVEEYFEDKIHKSEPEPGRIFSMKFEGWCKYFSSIKRVSQRKLAPSRNVVFTLQSGRIAWTLSLKLRFCKIPVVDEKNVDLATDRDWKSDRTSFKASVLKLQRRCNGAWPLTLIQDGGRCSESRHLK